MPILRISLFNHIEQEKKHTKQNKKTHDSRLNGIYVCLFVYGMCIGKTDVCFQIEMLARVKKNESRIFEHRIDEYLLEWNTHIIH